MEAALGGFCTYYFTIFIGVRQGFQLSFYLFLLAAEVLAFKIRQDNRINGIKIFGTEFKLSQFADETSAFLDSLTSAETLVETLNDYGKISGLKLNAFKTKATWLGPWRNQKAKRLRFEWTKVPVRILGVHVSYNEEGNAKRNFAKKVQNLNTTFDTWSCQNLTIFGRCLILKCLGISHLTYSTSMLVVPS